MFQSCTVDRKLLSFAICVCDDKQTLKPKLTVVKLLCFNQCQGGMTQKQDLFYQLSCILDTKQFALI